MIWRRLSGIRRLQASRDRLPVPDEPHDGFNVIGVREHVDGLDTLGAVTGIQDRRQFSGQRIEITRNIDGAWRRNTLENSRQDWFRTSLPRRIEDDCVPGF